MWINSEAKVPEDEGKSRSFHQRSGSVIKKWHINNKPCEKLPYEDIFSHIYVCIKWTGCAQIKFRYVEKHKSKTF